MPEAPSVSSRARWPVRLGVGALCLALIALLVYGLVARSPDRTIDDALRAGVAPRAPAYDLAVLTTGRPGPRLAPAVRAAFADGRVASGELRGTPLVVNFWASWCVPCREEAPILRRAWRRARPLGVLFVGIDMQDLSGDARAFERRLGIDYPSIRDPDAAVARRYGVTGVPETYFVSRAGRVVGHVIGVVTASDLRAGIAAARAGRVIGARRDGAQGRTR